MTELSTAELADQLRALPPSAGRVTIVAVDGRSGSGKTTLADRLGVLLPAPVLHLEEMYPGWTGLSAGIRVARAGIVDRFAANLDAEWRSWDWHAARPGPTHTQVQVPIVVLEGCGAGAREIANGVAALLWLEVDADERRARIRSRGGWQEYEQHFTTWADQEDELFERDRPFERADAIIRDVAPSSDARDDELWLYLPAPSRLRREPHVEVAQ